MGKLEKRDYINFYLYLDTFYQSVSIIRKIYG